jgi:RNA polymerase sigma factor (sigma-70 family)
MTSVGSAESMESTGSAWWPRVRPVVVADSVSAQFEAAIGPLLPDLLRYFARRVLPSADAADCASEAALVMWQHRTRLPVEAEDQRAWAFRIARHVHLNHGRKRVRRAAIDASLRAAVAPGPVEVSERAQQALEALECLSELDRELVRLVVWDGFGVAEAGRVLRLGPEAARKRYQRARERLRVALGE